MPESTTVNFVFRIELKLFRVTTKSLVAKNYKKGDYFATAATSPVKSTTEEILGKDTMGIEFAENFCVQEIFSQIFTVLNQMRFKAERLLDAAVKDFGLKVVESGLKKQTKLPPSLGLKT